VIWTEAGRIARLAEMDQHLARRADLIGHHGLPEPIAASAAMAMAVKARVPAVCGVAADDIYASIYRDDAAAEGWMDSNLENHGYPTLARVPLPDGRVVGILDLRPALDRARRDVTEEGQQR
jgi:hypothetical protein